MPAPVGDSKPSFSWKTIGVALLVVGVVALGAGAARYLTTEHLGSLRFWPGNFSPLSLLWGTILTAVASGAFGICLQWKSGEVPACALKMQIAALVTALAGFLASMAVWPPG